MDTPFKLTKRQKEVILLLAQGYNIKEIAALLCIAKRTAEKHSENILKNLRAKSVGSAIVRAHQHKIIDINSTIIRI